MDEMDQPIKINPNDPRYTHGANLMQVVLIGVDLARALYVNGHFADAKSVLGDCSRMTSKTLELLEDIGDVDGILMVTKTLSGIKDRISQVDEAINEYGEHYEGE
jgi:hypothetical protein